MESREPLPLIVFENPDETAFLAFLRTHEPNTRLVPSKIAGWQTLTLNETDFLTKTSGPIRIVVPDAQAELDLETPEGVQAAGQTLARIVPATENALSHHSSIAEQVSRLPRALGLNFIYNGHALGNGLLQRTGVEPVAAHLLRSIQVWWDQSMNRVLMCPYPLASGRRAPFRTCLVAGLAV